MRSKPPSILCWFAAIVAIAACIFFSTGEPPVNTIPAQASAHNQLLKEAGR